MRGNKISGITEFKSLEEEKEYWEARGPLAEGNEGTIHKPKSGQKRSSFLVVRLTGDELARLGDMAAKQGIGPSTFTRLLILREIDQFDKSSIDKADVDVIAKEIAEHLSSLGVQLVRERPRNTYKTRT